MSKETRSVLLLGGGIDAVVIAGRIKEMGLGLIVADTNLDAPALRGTDRVLAGVSCYSTQDVLAALIALGLRPAAIIGGGTDTPLIQAAIADAYGIVGPSLATARLSADKVHQIEALRSAGIPVPRFGRTTEGMDGYIVIKPADSRGARGVSRVLSSDSRAVTRAASLAVSMSPTKRYIIEEWVNGTQLSSESLVQDGRILWTAYAERNYARLEEFAPNVIEDGSDMPPTIPLYYERDYQQVCGEVLQSCVEAIGLQNGTLKSDLVWADRNCVVIEVAVRLSGGGFCSQMIPSCWNVDFVGMAVRIALGERVYLGEIRPYLIRHVAQRFRFPVRPTCHPERGGYVLGLGSSTQSARDNAEKQLHGARPLFGST